MKSAIENMKMLKKEATIVAEALENTMHQLPVHGAKVSYFKNLPESLEIIIFYKM